MKNKDNVQFIKEENNLLQEKFLFTREMYQETIEDKNLYKKQILGSKDSFGKIFDITRKLDVIQPQELYIETIRVLEDVLENKTFGLYTLNRENGYGRLETASAQVQGNYPNSIKLSEYSAAMEELENGNVWANREFLENYPMYMAGGQSRADVIVFPESFQDSFRPGGNVSSACIGISESSGISTVCERNAYIKNRIF